MDAIRQPFPYRRIAEDLRSKILSGELAPGERLPSRSAIAKTYQTTRATADRAIAALAAEGMAVSQQGRGAFVRSRPRVRLLNSAENYRLRRGSGKSNFVAEVEAQGQRGEQRLLEVTTIEAPADISMRLELGDEDRVVVRRLLFLVDDVPVQFCDAYYPEALAAGTSLAVATKIPGGSHSVIEDPAGPIRRNICRFVEDLEVRMPVPREVEVLQLPPGVPVVRVLRTAHDTEDVPVEVLDSIVPSDRHIFRYVIDVRPEKDQPVQR
jgi:GntR family transcriptional regulator